MTKTKKSSTKKKTAQIIRQKPNHKAALISATATIIASAGGIAAVTLRSNIAEINRADFAPEYSVVAEDLIAAKTDLEKLTV